MKIPSILALLLFGAVVLPAQIPPDREVRVVPGQVEVEQRGTIPVYKITVIGRTVRAVNYRYRRGDTNIDFAGTPLLPDAKGRAEVQSNQGYTRIDVKFNNLTPATRFGPDYLTYVLWAVTPDGRATNLGELVLNNNDHAEVKVTTELQTFGMIVTAEPYFAVTRPSEFVVMENIVRYDTKGMQQPIEAKAELLKRGTYTQIISGREIPPLAVRGDLLQLVEARNAIRIADWFEADKYAAETFQNAVSALQRAEEYYAADRNNKSVAMLARQATQTAEDARLIALQREEEERQERLRAQAAEARENAAQARENAAQARLKAEEEARRRVQAEAEQQRLSEARSQALEQQRNAQAEAERARLAAQQAEQLRQQSELMRQQSEQARLQAEREKEQTREQLREQLNQVLATRETARGLVMSMSDVLFDTGRWTLKPGARERLSRVGGILISHPGLKIEVEGHTDSVGSEDFNQELSERRAEAVRSYLVSQGVPSDSITSRGFGEGMPVTSNDSAAGRQQNRRVELVVSGEPILSRTPATEEGQRSRR